jgi:predicted YcjX-like family ATPase
VEVLALASVSDAEGTVSRRGEQLPSIIGTPLPGEKLDGRVFDGAGEIAMFPGDLPDKPETAFENAVRAGWHDSASSASDRLGSSRPAEGLSSSLPHIRLDRRRSTSSRRPAGMSKRPRAPPPSRSTNEPARGGLLSLDRGPAGARGRA